MSKQTYRNERCIIFDESGNLGSAGRYFVISCIDTHSYKSLHNIMVRKLGVARTQFPEIINGHAHEIKAADAHPCVKYHILECIATKDISVSYIVLDKQHAKPELLEDKNIMYNYLSKILLAKMIGKDDSNTTIHILCDNHTTKITSLNSFGDYIKIYFNYEQDLGIDLDIQYLDSDSADAYVVQAADYVANAVWTKYEHGYSIYADRLNSKYQIQDKFPYKMFGM